MQNYIDLMTRLTTKLSNVTTPRGDRTGTGTASVFGERLVFDLDQGFPLLPYREMDFKNVVVELLWFLRGSTSIEFLERHGCKWWSEQCSKTGDVGPLYPLQWRGDGDEYPDQFFEAVSTLLNDPTSRRIVVNSWDAKTIPPNSNDYDDNVSRGRMAIAPCHPLFQFYVEEVEGRRFLQCQFYMRSSDTFLGLPANIASYALLTHIVAQLIGATPKKLIWIGGDVHLYANHLDAAKKLLDQRRAKKIELPIYTMPDLSKFGVRVDNGLNFDDDGLVGALTAGLHHYYPAAPIRARMAR